MKKLLSFAALAVSLMITFSCSNSPEKTERAQEGYTGPRNIKVPNRKMTPGIMLYLGRLSDPQLSPDGTKILYGVSYTSLSGNRTCRNLFVSNTDGSNKIQLTKEGKSISNARWSKDGKEILFIQGGQIWKAPFADGVLDMDRKSCISDVSAGISGFTIAPTGDKLLYISTVPNPKVTSPKDMDVTMNLAQAYVTEDLMYRHWDHWVTELPQTFIAGLDEKITPETSTNILGEDAARYELPLEPYGGTEQLSWSPDGKFIAYSCKKLNGKAYAFSTDTEIYIYDTENKFTRVIPMAGGYDTDPVFSPDGRHLAWISMARNGYEADKTRLFTADISNNGEPSNITELTSSFKYNAASPAWALDSKSVYFNSIAEGLQGIFRADASGVARITEENLWYNFDSPFAILSDGTLLASYCSLMFPNELVAVKPGQGEARMTERKPNTRIDPVNGEEIVTDGYLYADCPVIPGATITRISHENDEILEELDAPTCEARWTKTVDGKKMLTWILYPPKFDPEKTWPAIEILLGGPQGTLDQGWSYRWNYRLMASKGYIVTMPNRRGTTAFGQPWCEEISGDYPGLNMQDYMTAGRNLKKEPYVGKLAGCGASYGGYSVYYLEGVHGDLYDCFIAHAGIFDEKYMWAETEEMWFPNWDNGGLKEFAYEEGKTGPAGDGITFGGLQQAGAPWSNSPKAARHYAASPINNIRNWHTPILCTHGMMDFRIPYDQGMAAFNAAQMMGVPSKLIVFPEENHWILKPQNALFWHEEYFKWLDKWCK